MLLPDGAQSLEPDDHPAPDAPPAEPVQAEPSPAAQAAPDDADDAEPPDDPAEGAMVPLAAHRAVKAHLKTLKEDAERLRLRAAEADRILPVVEQWRPIIEAIRARPDLIEQATRPRQPDPVESSISDQDAAEYARDIQLYDQAGKLDIATAKRALARQTKVATQAAREAAQSVVMPLQQRDATREKAVTRQAVLQSAAAEGDPLDAETFDTLWNVLPPELVAQNPQGIGELVKRVARGSQPRRPAPVPAPGPVVHTEAPGGRQSPITALTDLDRRMANLTGKKHSEWADTAKRFKPGVANVLED